MLLRVIWFISKRLENEEIRAVVKKNAKPQINLIRNESLKKMATKLEDEIMECT